MSRIFLSYARDDVDAAKQLAEGISEAGHDVWWDRNLHGGSRFGGPPSTGFPAPEEVGDIRGRRFRQKPETKPAKKTSPRRRRDDVVDDDDAADY